MLKSKTLIALGGVLLIIMLFYGNVISNDEYQKKEFGRFHNNKNYLGNNIVTGFFHHSTNSAFYHLFALGLLCLKFACLRYAIQALYGSIAYEEMPYFQERIWNFLLIKILFLYGIMDMHTIGAYAFWIYWFTAILSLLYTSIVCNTCFNNMPVIPETSDYHSKVFKFLVGVTLNIILLIPFIIVMNFPISSTPSSLDNNKRFHFKIFMITDCIFILLEFLRLIGRYLIHFSHVLQLHKDALNYSIDLIVYFDKLLTSTFYCVHMLFYSNVWISVTTVIILTQLISIVREILNCFQHYLSCKEFLAKAENPFPPATTKDLKKYDDRCAICLDVLKSGCRLPCDHIYHVSCIITWLNEENSCPSCRAPIEIETDSEESIDQTDEDERPDLMSWYMNSSNLLLRINGATFNNWLPSVTIRTCPTDPTDVGTLVFVIIEMRRGNEVRHPPNVYVQAMVEEVYQRLAPEAFPSDVEIDVRYTQSVEQTLTNISRCNLMPHEFNSSRFLVRFLSRLFLLSIHDSDFLQFWERRFPSQSQSSHFQLMVQKMVRLLPQISVDSIENELRLTRSVHLAETRFLRQMFPYMFDF